MNKIGFGTTIWPEIVTKFKSFSNCTVPKCSACQLACTMKRNPGVIKQPVVPKTVNSTTG